MKRVEVKPGEKSEHSVETLEQITKEWIKQQRSRFENPTSTFHKKRIPNKFSEYSVLKLFKKTMYKKRRLDDILYVFRLYIPDIAALPKNIWNNFVRSIEFMLRIERYENKAGKK
jgi:hypothetical protein